MNTKSKNNNIVRVALTLLVLLVSATTWAQSFTVTLQSGTGSGDDITISSADPANMAANQSSANGGQFWMEGSELWFTLPDCPSTFSSPDDDKVFRGWNNGSYGSLNPGLFLKITEDMTFVAYWDNLEFEVEGQDDEGDRFRLTYRVTSTSPAEVEVKEFSCDNVSCDLVIPATVEYEGVTYAVTSIGEKAFYECDHLTSVTFAEGSQLKSIGNSAFGSCYNLTTVTLYSNPTIERDGFPHNATVTMTLPANAADDAYWTTFYNDSYFFQADENTTVYKATVNGAALELHEVEDKIVNYYTPVILKSTGNSVVMTRVSDWGTDWSDNDLQGLGERTARADILTDINEGKAIYVMGKVGDDFGFFEYTGDYVPANKAYILADAPSAGAPKRMAMSYADGTTDIADLSDLTCAEDDAWYTLSGVKLTGTPTEKGVYIYQGKKVVRN